MPSGGSSLPKLDNQVPSAYMIGYFLTRSARTNAFQETMTVQLTRASPGHQILSDRANGQRLERDVADSQAEKLRC